MQETAQEYSCRLHVGNGGDLSGKRKTSSAANPDNLENGKEAEGGAQGTQGLSKNCTSRDMMPPLSRLVRGFRNKYH